MDDWKDYPNGDGHPDCAHCHGRGVVALPKELRPRFAVGELTQVCTCVLARDIKMNLERGWRGLSKALPIKASPLKGLEKTNLRVLASTKATKEHLKHVAARMGPRWGFQVTSDAAMMDAWLSKGLAQVFDPDVEEMRAAESRRPHENSPYEALSELVEPSVLLVVILGVKAARNKAMPEVLLEALTLRDFAGRPTWLFEQPACPFTEGHRSWSPAVEAWLESWKRVTLSRPASVGQNPASPVRPGPSQSFVMARETGSKPDAETAPESTAASEWERDELARVREGERKNWKKRKGKKG